MGDFLESPGGGVRRCLGRDPSCLVGGRPWSRRTIPLHFDDVKGEKTRRGLL